MEHLTPTLCIFTQPQWNDFILKIWGKKRNKNDEQLQQVEEPVRKWSAEPVKKKSSTYFVNVDINNIRVVDKVMLWLSYDSI